MSGTRIELDGTANTRDLGAYEAAAGRRVKTGKLFRSDELANLSERDIAYFEQAGLKTIVDFRTPEEKRNSPDRAIPGARRVELPIDVGSLIDYMTLFNAPPEENRKYLVLGNRFFVDKCQNEYRAFFALLANEANTPLLFHCTAGKDRAGFAAALLLSALGVSRETVLADYMLSGPNVSAHFARTIEAQPAMAPLLTTYPEYLNAAFAEIDDNYGGINDFLTQRLGVDLEKLRQLYTE
jgi:protein-tyrosine phosphatase